MTPEIDAALTVWLGDNMITLKKWGIRLMNGSDGIAEWSWERLLKEMQKEAVKEAQHGNAA